MSADVKRWAGHIGWPVMGLLLAVGLWALGARQLSDVDAIRDAFAPRAGFAALWRLLVGGELWLHCR